MSLATSLKEINIGDALLASLYCEDKVKYIVIGKIEQPWLEHEGPDGSIVEEGVNIVYDLYVLWVDDASLTIQAPTGRRETQSQMQGQTIRINHRTLIAHCWSFDLDKLTPEEVSTELDYQGSHRGYVVG
tara:strand:+ start:341 stop:730 length:390 start_codon:yes stop_codon:yes gene_type:complete